MTEQPQTIVTSTDDRLSITGPAMTGPLVTIGPVSIGRDGSVSYPPGTDLNEAAQTFWAALAAKSLSVRACGRCDGSGLDPAWSKPSEAS